MTKVYDNIGLYLVYRFTFFNGCALNWLADRIARIFDK